MDKRRTLVRRGNPLRSDVSWQWNLVQGLIALGVGLYTLLAEERAQRNFVFLIGVFLLVNASSTRWKASRRGERPIR